MKYVNDLIETWDVETPIVCCYHDQCWDGFTAAALFRERFPLAKFVPVRHGESLPIEQLKGANVVFLDICPKWRVLETVAEVAESVLIIDHHVSAFDELTTIFPYDEHRFALHSCVKQRTATLYQLRKVGRANVNYVYSDTLSGAGLTAGILGAEFPFFAQVVQDRDLWKFENHATKAIMAWAQTQEFSVDGVLKIIDELEGMAMGAYVNRDSAEETGQGILRYQAAIIAEIVSRAGTITIAGHKVPFVICQSPMLISELGSALAEKVPNLFVVIGCPEPDGSTRFSLRSKGFDVAKIATKYGGGGHVQAAGFIRRPGESL